MTNSEIKKNMVNLLPEIKSLVELNNHEIDTNTGYGLGVFVEGIKLEWNTQGRHIKLGYGCSPTDNDNIANLLSIDHEITRSRGGCVIVYPNPTVDNFKEIYDIVINHKLKLENPQRIRRGKVNFNKDSVFLKAAKVIKLSVDEGLPQLISRAAGIFDGIDEIITIGESISRTPENSYREHIVPCDFLVREAVEMYKNNSSLVEIAIMFQQNCFIVLITPDEAKLLDSTLGLKIDMPNGWKIGDNPLARLNFAKIKLK